MSKFKVYMEQMASTVIEVEDAEDVDAAIDQAWEETPTLCAHCSGWGNGPGIDLSGDWEPSEVMDEAGNVVWTEAADE